MAAHDKTEAATPRRRQRARERGTIARSPMATSVGSVGGAVLLLAIAGGWIWGWLVDTVTRPVPAVPDDPGIAWAMALLGRVLLAVGVPVLIVAGGAAAGAVMIGIAQNGFNLSAVALQPNAARMNPLSGITRMFSGRLVVDAVRILLTLVIVLLLLKSAVTETIARLVAGAAMTPAGVAGTAHGVASHLVFRLIGFGALVAVADYAWQRWRTERDLRMTRRELRDEIRETEGDPYWKARRRARARALARTRMMREVPTATVVVTNPTHFAVALRYTPALAAPVVVAKGQGPVAARIRAIAWRAGVPIHPNPPLAQALYKSVEVGQHIPPRLYTAVAEILAWVYRNARPEVAHV
ncbi:MAG: EscU/YscU/HrcU family type III secretion system export apparatus switch protein [bacterium]